MNAESVIELLQNFKSDRIIETLEQLNLDEWIHNPWFLGGVGAFALVALFMKWRLLLATVVGIVGMAGLLQYTLEQGTELTSLGNQSLIIFIGGGLLIAIIFIYLVVIKSD